MNLIEEIYASAHFDMGETQQSRKMELDIQKILNGGKRPNSQIMSLWKNYFPKQAVEGRNTGSGRGFDLEFN